MKQNLNDSDNQKNGRILTYLEGLKGNRLEWKRSLNAPIRYAGGKSLAVGTILSSFPRNLNRLVSPFIGGGSIEFACSSLGIEIVSSDIFDKLVNFYNVLKENKQELITLLKQYDTSKETFESIRSDLIKDFKGEDKIKNNVELAAKYFYNHNLSYGPSYLGWSSGNYLNNPKKYSRMIEKLEKTDLSKMTFFNEDFKTFIPRYKEDFLYLDPPYFLGGSSKMFTGIYPMRNHPYHHKNFDHEKLREILKDHKGGFVLSYNDCIEIREMYKGYEIKEVAWQYTMGQGEKRIGKNRLEKDLTNIKSSHEILIIGKSLKWE